jgi:hypothetical protein
VQQISREALYTLRRFPFVLLVAAAGTLAALLLIEESGTQPPELLVRTLFAALLGVAFLTGLTLYAEKRRWATIPKLALQAVGVSLLIVYACALPENVFSAPAVHAIRLLLLAVGLHLFVSFAPWLGSGDVDGFWDYNRELFQRLLTAGLFTGVLFAGLAIALAAVENLFELEVPGERYGQLWIFLVGMFLTWFFLAGVPEQREDEVVLVEYPKGLKIFAQYVLFPLVGIYLVILTAYSGKIVLEWSWPFGWVSRLILGFAAAGMFSMLLLHPIREHSGNGWMITASRWFYIVLAPLLVMYFLAVLQRLSDYGLTEGRYFAIVVGIWLAAMLLYFLFSRGKNIKVIPMSLCVLAFAASAGPWSAFSISENSQVGRLRTLLEANEILAGDSLQPATETVPFEDAREISAVLQYLHDVHGYERIQPWFTESLRADTSVTWTAWKAPSDVARMIGIEFVTLRSASPGGTITYDASRTAPLRVTGYDELLAEHYFGSGIADRTVTAGTVTYSMNGTLDTLTFIHAQDEAKADTLRLPLARLIASLTTRYHGEGAGDIPLEDMSIVASTTRTRVKMYVHWLQLKKEAGAWQPEGLRLRVLYGLMPRD